MEIIKNELKRLILLLEKRCDTLQEDLRRSPDGRLTYRREKDSFYIVTGHGREYKRKLIKDQPLLKTFAYKEYASIVITDLMKTLDELRSIANAFDNYSIGNVIDKMKYAYRCLPRDYFVREDRNYSGRLNAYQISSKEWAQESFNSNPYKPEQKDQITSRGLRVRSKSEVLIAELYYSLGIEFRYEDEVKLGDRVFYPDFTILMPDGSNYYHEHAGMMDLPMYRNRHSRKMTLYEEAGITPWENLLVTYDKNGAINMQEMELLVKGAIECKVNSLLML